MKEVAWFAFALLVLVGASYVEDERGRACVKAGGRWVDSGCELMRCQP